MSLGPNHKPGCTGEFAYSGEGYNRVKVCRCGAEDHAPEVVPSLAKPSAEALKRWSAALPCGVDVDPEGDLVELDDVIELLADERRKARAEAFKFIEDELRVEGRAVSADFVEALAAKERAQ